MQPILIDIAFIFNVLTYELFFILFYSSLLLLLAFSIRSRKWEIAALSLAAKCALCVIQISENCSGISMGSCNCTPRCVLSLCTPLMIPTVMILVIDETFIKHIAAQYSSPPEEKC